jgi:hypothetical protein
MAAADEVYGPDEFQSECLSAENQGMVDGRWSDYECKANRNSRAGSMSGGTTCCEKMEGYATKESVFVA